MPENSATAMAQDSDGYLWFGTFKGLVRFDGNEFTVFDRSNTPELPSDGIVNLHLDRKGHLWVSTLGGLVVREGANWRIIRKPQLREDYIRTFAERANGDLLLTTFDGKVLEYTQGQLNQLPAPPGDPTGGYLGGVDEDGRWWVGQSKFTGRWNGKAWQSSVPAADLDKTEASHLAMAHARDGGLWLLLASELCKYSHGIEVSRRHVPEAIPSCWSMTEDSRSNIWICTVSEGICEILPDGEMLKWNEENGISYHGTRFVFEDREKNLWVGSSGGGLQRLKPRRFRSFGPEAGLSERVVRTVAPAPGGGVWIGTYGGGLFRWTEAGITNVLLPGWTNRHIYVQSVLSDSKGRTWVGTYGGPLFMLHGNDCRSFPTQQLGGGNVLALFEDSKERIWVSNGSGILVFEDGSLRKYDRQNDPVLGGVCCFAEDRDKSIWLSTQEKVYRLEKDFFVEMKDKGGGQLRGVVCIKSDADGTVWMGSIGGGLLRWKKGAISRIGLEQGLPVANIHGILEDAHGYFWMPSNRGIIRAARDDLRAAAEGVARKSAYHLFDLNDGMPSVECSSQQQPNCAIDPMGRLWFATLKGVAMTDPTGFRPNTVQPSARIESVAYSEEAHDVGKNNGSRRWVESFPATLKLPAGSHAIEIHYTAPSFTSPEKVKFQTSLDGRQVDWNDVGNRRIAYLDEIEPGHHVFRVRAANEDGLWSESGASLAFTVLPFFWQTRWFQGLIIAGICGVGLLWAYRYKVVLERKQATQEAFTRQLIESQEQERNRVASELHDGLGQDLLIMKNRLRMLAEGASQEVSSQLLEISSSTSQAIAEVRKISQALRPSALEQVGLTKAIEWMVEQIAQASPAKYSTELENIDGLLPAGMEINVYRILQEALNNVMKHSQASEVIVELKKQPKAILASVFDNGRGFDIERADRKGELPQGFGLSSMKERANVLGGQLEFRSAEGKGTRLTLIVPLKRDPT